jgi:hypothetical protein
MSISVPPPEFQFNGLIYNPDFWINSTSSLTQDVANQLYLRKTVTDSASALETFNGGIRADSIDVINASGLKTMFATQTGAVTLFPNILAGQTLRIGNPSVAQSIHVGNIDIAQNTINCASAPINGGIIIGDKQTGTGSIDIGYSSVRAGNINIANPASACAIRIGRPLTIAYTSLPVVGQLGYSFTPAMTKVDNFPTGTAIAQTGTTTTTTTSAVPAGLWLITATQNIECKTASGTINYIKLTVRNTTVNPITPIGIQENQSVWTTPVALAIGSLNASIVNVSTAGGCNYSFTYEINYTGVGAVYAWFGNQTSFRFTRVG